MCGIWASSGFVVDDAVIERVAHRGPDGYGWRTFDPPSGPVSLGHRRLAIFDTSSAGQQPMTLEGRALWIVFNGAIYNFIEIRNELKTMGYSFLSNSDTEVLLTAYVAWGPDCLDRLNGMFSFVIWDEEKRHFFAARDRFGIKPLYYLATNEGIAFASEIKQFLEIKTFRTQLDLPSAYDFLAFGRIEHRAETFFSGVKQLQAGQCLHIDLNHPTLENAPTPEYWYRLPEEALTNISAAQATEELQERLIESVDIRLRSDVPVGFCLSGGLDSSSIVSIATPKLAKNTQGAHTFSACYDDPSIDESAYIKSVIKHTGANSTIIRPSGDELPGLIEKIVYHQDAPFSSTSMISQWMVFAAARKAGIPVMLDGQGADEHLCGYHSSFGPQLVGLMRDFSLAHLFREMAGQRRRHSKSLTWQVAVISAGLLPDSLRRKILHGGSPYRPNWMSGAFAECGGMPPEYFHSLSELMYSHMRESSLPGLLRYEDRNSMAHGIESRLPFLDYRLVELSLSLGKNYKIVNGETKWILREAMRGILPENIRTRQDKIGFATPEQAWLRHEGRGMLEDGISMALDTFPELFDATATNQLMDKAFITPHHLNPALWRIACFGIWCRVFRISG